MAMQVRVGGWWWGGGGGGAVTVADVSDWASKLFYDHESKLFPAPPFLPSPPCPSGGGGLQQEARDDLNTFKGSSLTASVLPVRRPQGCSPL